MIHSYELAVWSVVLLGIGTGLVITALILWTIADIREHRWHR